MNPANNVIVILSLSIVASCGGSSNTTTSTSPQPASVSAAIPNEVEAIPLGEMGNGEQLIPIVRAPDLDRDGIPDIDDDDIDGDGIENSEDNDNDNDGVRDFRDQLRLNPDEHSDFDRDGVGDNADDDDDNDGVADVDDLAPRNQLCSKESDTNESGVCLIDIIKKRLPDAVIDNAHVAYIPFEQNIYRFDLENKSFLSTIESFDGSNVTVLRYEEKRERLLAGYSSGLITYIDRNLEQHEFIKLGDRVNAIISTPQWIITNSYPFDFPPSRMYDVNGQYVNGWSMGNGIERHHSLWIDAKQTLVWFELSLAGWDTVLRSRRINVDDIPSTKSNTLEKASTSMPYAMKQDGSIIVTGRDNIYDGDTLQKVGTLPSDEYRLGTTGLNWSTDHGIVRQSVHWTDDEFHPFLGYAEYFVMEQLDVEYSSYNVHLVEGRPKNFLWTGLSYFYMYERESELWLGRYEAK